MLFKALFFFTCKFIEFDYKSNHAYINHLVCIGCADTKIAGDHGELFPILTIVFRFLKAFIIIYFVCVCVYELWLHEISM